MDERDRRIQSAAPFRILSPKGNTQLVSSMKPQSASIRPTTAKKAPGEASVSFQNQISSPKSFQVQSGSIKSPTAQQFGPDATVQSQFQMTATSPKTLQSLYINSVRPATAATYQNQNNVLNNRNIQSANQRGFDTINDRFMPEDEEYYHHQQEQSKDNQNQETGKKIKHWKFTKKYDTNGKQGVRNQSALKKIVMDGQNGQAEQEDDEQLQHVQERAMITKLNGQKIFITREGEVLGNKEDQEVNRLRKYSPSERDKLHFFDSFQSQRQFLNQGDVQFKKIYATQLNEQNDQGGSSSRRQLTPGNENDRNQKNMSQNDSYQKGQSVKFQSNQSQGGSRRKIERPQTAVGFSSSGTSMKNNLTKVPNVQHKKRINSSKPQFYGGNESVKLFTEDEQKLFSMKKIKSAIFNPNGPNKFFAAKDYTPLEFTEWYFPNQQKDFSFKVIVIDMKTMNFVKYDNVKVQNNTLVHTTYKEEQQVIQFERIFTLLSRQNQPTHPQISPLSFYHILTQLLVDDQKMRSSFESIHSQHKDYDVIDRGQSEAYISQQDQYQNYQLNHPFNYQQEYTQERVNVQIKRPTTAHPYQSTNNNYYNNTQQDSNYTKLNAQYNSNQQGSLQQQFLQKQLPHLNQHLLPSSSQQQLHSEQQLLNRYSSNQQLPSHLSHASLLQSGSNSTLQKPNLQHDYTKHSSTKSGIRPKTAVSKGMRSPSSASLLGLGSGTFADQQKHHLNQNQIHQMQEQLRNDGRKYEKNVKGFSTPMFIKGSHLQPSFGKDNRLYKFNQY